MMSFEDTDSEVLCRDLVGYGYFVFPCESTYSNKCIFSALHNLEYPWRQTAWRVMW